MDFHLETGQGIVVGPQLTKDTSWKKNFFLIVFGDKVKQHVHLPSNSFTAGNTMARLPQMLQVQTPC